MREHGLFPSSDPLTWDGGTLGMVTVCHPAALAVRMARWATRLRAIATRLAREDHAALRDATLTRGVAGALHMFHRWYRATGDELFAKTARSWFLKLVRRRRPGIGVGGYRVFMRIWQRAFLDRPDYPAGWIGLPGFYNGAAGIGLALLAATTTVE